ncbi:hypothetical protein TRFO_36776 [Tritrichomonas foetus]|uniref:Uncharacterized protein n=1 Tax=Tritrichomonas foetus TaxID=1144522 RepID=A0A1J4JEH8_9EUKA|nr:hypothetical protein TRFO_36776 [Tritrichomonas foetus]|eukprot:OHS97057.1 hypothetical protein TRFO_36776 [Tritrichomonas foetus]
MPKMIMKIENRGHKDLYEKLFPYYISILYHMSFLIINLGIIFATLGHKSDPYLTFINNSNKHQYILHLTFSILIKTRRLILWRNLFISSFSFQRRTPRLTKILLNSVLVAERHKKARLEYNKRFGAQQRSPSVCSAQMKQHQLLYRNKGNLSFSIR